MGATPRSHPFLDGIFHDPHLWKPPYTDFSNNHFGIFLEINQPFWVLISGNHHKPPQRGAGACYIAELLSGRSLAPRIVAAEAGLQVGEMDGLSTGWWFGTFYIFPYIGNNHPNWLIFFRGVAEPPTSRYPPLFISDNSFVIYDHLSQIIHLWFMIIYLR